MPRIRFHTVTVATLTILATMVGPSTVPTSGTASAQPPAAQAASQLPGAAPRAPLRQVAGPLVVAVGDIACEPGSNSTRTTCRQAATARQARAYRPERAFVLGDAQYPDASLSAFRSSYDRSWGALRPITEPVPGNHEYRTPGAAGYYHYFRNRQPGAPGYYTFRVGKWRFYALNSNCDEVSCAREARWLDAAMTRHPRPCSAILLHHPLYSSGLEHGDSPEGRPFWRVALRHHTDIALAGHDHDYERFRPMNAGNHRSPNGLRSWVVGTGGKNLYRAGAIRKGSAVFDNHAAGVLALKLGARRYGWQYQTIDGKLVDSGIASCR